MLIAFGVARRHLIFLRELQPDYWNCLNQFGLPSDSQALSEGRMCELQPYQSETTSKGKLVPNFVNLHLRTIAAAIQTVPPPNMTGDVNESHLFLYGMCGVVAIPQRESSTVIQIFSRFSLASPLSKTGIP